MLNFMGYFLTTVFSSMSRMLTDKFIIQGIVLGILLLKNLTIARRDIWNGPSLQEPKLQFVFHVLAFTYIRISK